MSFILICKLANSFFRRSKPGTTPKNRERVYMLDS